MASRGSNQKGVQCQRALALIQNSDHYLIDITSSLKFGFQATFDSACPHFTPSQGFWVLLSCHCHRQDSFRYFTEFSRDSRVSREVSNCGKERRFRPFPRGFLENLVEILEILENSQIVEKKGDSDHFLEIL